MALQNKEGQKVPEVAFRARKDGDWKTYTTEELFKGKKVVVFALPGAFTPTCSTSHLPRYNELAPFFKNQGIDDIICLSVNDGFVMEEWGKHQDAENVTLLPDGNGEFSEKLGMLVDKTDLGFGKRSWRYSMYVEDGVIKKMFIEPEKPGDPYEVSDADTMKQYLFPNIKTPEQITVLSKPGCGFCDKAKGLLSDRGLPYEELSVGKEIELSTLRNLSGSQKTPQIFIDGKHIGGAEELESYLSS